MEEYGDGTPNPKVVYLKHPLIFQVGYRLQINVLPRWL